MSQDYNRTKKVLEEIEKVTTLENLKKHLVPLNDSEIERLAKTSYNNESSKEGAIERRKFLEKKGLIINNLSGNGEPVSPESLAGNIENYIGMAQIPIGIGGPLLVNGTAANGEFFIPFATTEGALVASYNRGMKACRLSGGITSVCLVEGVQRSPFFKFDNIGTIGVFLKWLHDKIGVFQKIVEETSNYAKLLDMRTNVEGNSVILTFEYTTGDAAGQNMVTICTDKVCRYILNNCELQPLEWYIESNYSGDKKATALSFSNVRGKKVTSEIVIPQAIVKNILKTTPQQIAKYWQSSTLAVTQSGAIGAQGHVANGLTALFIACGQDVACISESSVGLTRMEVNKNNDLYVAMTLPSLIVGTIGGGTGLPTQKECLGLLDCSGIGKSRKFAEICCAVALAGELSIASAMSVDHFTTAHKKLGRK